MCPLGNLTDALDQRGSRTGRKHRLPSHYFDFPFQLCVFTVTRVDSQLWAWSHHDQSSKQRLLYAVKHVWILPAPSEVRHCEAANFLVDNLRVPGSKTMRATCVACCYHSALRGRPLPCEPSTWRLHRRAGGCRPLSRCMILCIQL